jgi:hypothetical protein
MDFTLQAYSELLQALRNNGYQFETFENVDLQAEKVKTVILRHDVDDKPDNSYRTALIEYNLGIKGTYYFRIVKQSFNKDIIKKISSLGHEIGYHYEDLALAKGDINLAIKLFSEHLGQFADLHPVKTICMHGSPLSKFDNRLMWKEFKYQDFGILKEPYFDIDFSKLLYLTDTGRRWDGHKVSVRDKAPKNGIKHLSDNFSFHTTAEIIEAVNKGVLPNKIMFNFHPQRWTSNKTEWVTELIWTLIKNQIKRIIVKTTPEFQI